MHGRLAGWIGCPFPCLKLLLLTKPWLLSVSFCESPATNAPWNNKWFSGFKWFQLFISGVQPLQLFNVQHSYSSVRQPIIGRKCFQGSTKTEKVHTWGCQWPLLVGYVASTISDGCKFGNTDTVFSKPTSVRHSACRENKAEERRPNGNNNPRILFILVDRMQQFASATQT